MNAGYTIKIGQIENKFRSIKFKTDYFKMNIFNFKFKNKRFWKANY